MRNNDSTSILASFATLKSLNDARKYKNSYQMLAEFIEYAIVTKNMASFTADQMKNVLKELFGFIIPEAVIKTAMHSIKNVLKNSIFTVERTELKDASEISEAKRIAEEQNNVLFERLIAFTKECYPDTVINREQLEADVIALLVGFNEKTISAYSEIISEFILINENDRVLQDALDAIRQGAILYIGINYNINDTGSIPTELNLFLATEVIFDIFGLNGEIYQVLARDFFDLVQTANSKEKRINLYFFQETKDEIDTYFSTARSILVDHSFYVEKVAMKTILDKCKTETEIAIMQSDLYHHIGSKYGIKLFDKVNFYDAKYNDHNLESQAEQKDLTTQNSWRYISHINKLRLGKVFDDFFACKYLFVTRSHSIIKASQCRTDELRTKGYETTNPFAISIEYITNLLWFKLGYGFGRKEYPKNVNAVLTAKTIISSNIAHNVEEEYSKVKAQFQEGEVSREQLAARIMAIQKKPLTPEEISCDSLEEDTDFSIEYLLRYEEQMEKNKRELKIKDERIKALEDSVIALNKEQERLSTEKDDEIQRMADQTQTILKELEKYRIIEEQKDLRRQKRKCITKFIGSIAWKVGIIVAVSVAAVLIYLKTKSDIPMIIMSVIDTVGLVTTIIVAVKSDYNKAFHNNEEKKGNDNHSS